MNSAGAECPGISSEKMGSTASVPNLWCVCAAALDDCGIRARVPWAPWAVRSQLRAQFGLGGNFKHRNQMIFFFSKSEKERRKLKFQGISEVGCNDKSGQLRR